MRRLLFVVLPLAALAVLAPGQVSSVAGAGAEDSAEEVPQGGLFNAPRQVDMPVIVVPVMDRQGTILSYAYLSLQVEVIGVDVWQVREKIPFIQDAFIRTAYSYSLAVPESEGDLDSALLRREFRRRASQFVTQGRVTRIIIKNEAVTAF